MSLSVTYLCVRMMWKSRFIRLPRPPVIIHRVTVTERKSRKRPAIGASSITSTDANLNHATIDQSDKDIYAQPPAKCPKLANQLFCQVEDVAKARLINWMSCHFIGPVRWLFFRLVTLSMCLPYVTNVSARACVCMSMVGSLLILQGRVSTGGQKIFFFYFIFYFAFGEFLKICLFIVKS